MHSHKLDHDSQVRQARENYHPHFTEEETKTERLRGVSVVTHPRVERVLEHMTLDLSPLFFPFTPRTETQHVQKQSCILFIKPEDLNQSCATESLRMLFLKTEVARFPFKLTRLEYSERDFCLS